ncbi:MAG: penicillin-binding protein 2 [Nitriliruptorales bacterium]|nr:penicillin-binding protein 2 [Nitriliruptorales bacterium]
MVGSRPVRSPPTTAAQLESTRLRLTFLTLLVVSLFLLLFARLWFLQVMAGERYVNLAEGNAVRTLTIAAPRGNILDRNDKPIVQNRFAMVVSVQPNEMGDRRDAILADVADLLGMSLQDVQRQIRGSRVSPFSPKPIAVDVPTEVALYIWENSSTRFPGVYAERLPVRQYPHGKTAAHVVGYLGEIGETELLEPEYSDYDPGDLIGWSGLERTYEKHLRGTKGVRRYEVNARGDILRELGDQVPVAGADLKTTLDLEAQKLVEKALEQGVKQARTVRDPEGRARGYYKAPAGAAVVMDPRDGGIVAMASYPTFEPEKFVGGVSGDYWDRLQNPKNHFPLINRVTQSSYPPGSVFKIVSAAAALEEGYVTPTSLTPCPGEWYWAGQRFRNWNTSDSGAITIETALEDSCDTVFYEMARRMWLDEQTEGRGLRERLADHARQWGFGKGTGIDLPSERNGVIPGRRWKQEFWESNRDSYCSQAKQAPKDSYAHDLFSDLCERGNIWRGGDAVNMSIGQGDVQTTPLQIANSFTAVANGGTLFRPRLGAQLVPPGEQPTPLPVKTIRELPVQPRHLDVIADGLRKVASQGTASATFAGFDVPVAGKTGTAEFRPKQPFAWFAAYAPAKKPEYVVVAMVEEGGGGSLNAAPIVRRILEGLLDLDPTDITPGVATD